MKNLDKKYKIIHQIKEIEEDKKEVELGYQRDELYRLYSQQLEEYKRKVELLRSEMAQMRKKHVEENSNIIEAYKSDISFLKSLANQTDGLDPENYSQEIYSIYRVFKSGFAMPRDLKRLVWVSPDHQYIVLKTRGYSYGQGFTFGYIEVSYYLYHVASAIQREHDVRLASGYLYSWSSKRWSKARLKEVENAILQHKINL